ncbi:hypothetical protein Nmel_000359 [Mimus melanotis]
MKSMWDMGMNGPRKSGWCSDLVFLVACL